MTFSKSLWRRSRAIRAPVTLAMRPMATLQATSPRAKSSMRAPRRISSASESPACPTAAMATTLSTIAAV